MTEDHIALKHDFFCYSSPYFFFYYFMNDLVYI